MTAAAESILKQALALPPADRAQLIEGLFSSFDSQDQDVNQRLSAEAESRIDAYERGDLTASSADDVYKRLGIG